MRWSEGGGIVFLCGDLLAFDREGDRVRPTAVEVQLVLALRDELPAGPISPDMAMDDILAAVAASFGLLVAGHRDHPHASLYTGPWDGAPVGVTGTSEDDRPIGVFGSRDAKAMRCTAVWAPSARRYVDWYAGWFRARLMLACLHPADDFTVMSDNLNFTPKCVERALPVAGLTTWQVHETVLQATASQQVNAEGFGLQLFTKTIGEVGQQRLVLAITRSEPDRMLIGMVLVCRPEWIDNDFTTPPLTVLDRLIDRFGVECEVGNLRGKLLLGREALGSEPGQPLRVRPMRGRPEAVMTCAHIKAIESSPTRHRVGLCFAIDLDRYRAANR